MNKIDDPGIVKNNGVSRVHCWLDMEKCNCFVWGAHRV
jgi:hypothetical protein